MDPLKEYHDSPEVCRADSEKVQDLCEEGVLLDQHLWGKGGKQEWAEGEVRL